MHDLNKSITPFIHSFTDSFLLIKIYDLVLLAGNESIHIHYEKTPKYNSGNGINTLAIQRHWKARIV